MGHASLTPWFLPEQGPDILDAKEWSLCSLPRGGHPAVHMCPGSLLPSWATELMIQPEDRHSRALVRPEQACGKEGPVVGLQEWAVSQCQCLAVSSLLA